MKNWMYVGAISASLIGSLVIHPQAKASEVISATVTPSSAVYAPNASLGFELNAVEGFTKESTLIISNRTRAPLIVKDFNYEVLMVVKPGVTLDLGARQSDLPGVVLITQPGESGSHYAKLKNGLILTAVTREGGAS